MLSCFHSACERALVDSSGNSNLSLARLYTSDCWEGQTSHSGIVPLPREQTRPGADCSSWGHPRAVTFPGAAGEVFAAPGRAANAGGSETASLVFQAMLDRKGHTKAKILCKLLVREQALVL